MTKGKERIILGVDPGTRCMGWGAISTGGCRYQCVDYGAIRPKQKDPAQVYLHLFEEITAVLEKVHPSAVSVETQYVDKNPQSALKLGMARGMVLLAAAKKGIDFFEYSPTKAKIAATGTGRASKEQVQQMTAKILGLTSIPTPSDAADALALAICHAHYYKPAYQPFSLQRK